VLVIQALQLISDSADTYTVKPFLLDGQTVAMSSVPPHGGEVQDNSNRDFDNAEKGLYDSLRNLPAPPPVFAAEKKPIIHVDTSLSNLSASSLSQGVLSPIHEGITPFSSVPVLSLTWPGGQAACATLSKPGKPSTVTKKPERPKPKISRWVLFNLWFNTYKKFFTFVTLLNLAGIIMAALGRFPYAENHLGALVLGNLLMAVLMRNELFLRVLYIVSIYGLRSVSRKPDHTGIQGLILGYSGHL
jgi:hypothetical protein